MKRAIYVAFVLLLVVVASAADTRGVGNLRGSDATHNSKDAATTLSPFHQLESAQVTQEHVRKLLFHGEIVKVLVKYKNANGMQHITDVASSTIAQSPKFHYIAITVDPQNLKELLNDPNIETVEFDSIVHAIRAVNWNHGNATATRRRRLAETVPWGIQRVQGLPSGQFVPPGPFANKIKVCVVDTGYGLGHPDLPSEGVTGFTSFGGRWDIDVNGHGTLCAGTILALGGNNQGVVGVIPNGAIAFHCGKAMGDFGLGSTSSVLSAVTSCAENGANVVSMSLCGGDYSTIQRDVYREYYQSGNGPGTDNEKGVLFVAAAGNDGNYLKCYPASYDAVISVAATDQSDNRAYFSQYNSQVEFSAPGVGVNSTVTTNRGKSFNYDTKSGTSMSTPHVAGAAALVWSYNPNCTATQIRRILLATAKTLGGGCNDEFGRGMIQIRPALDMLQSCGCEAADGLSLLDPSTGRNTQGTCFNYGTIAPSSTSPPTAPTPLPTSAPVPTLPPSPPSPPPAAPTPAPVPTLAPVAPTYLPTAAPTLLFSCPPGEVEVTLDLLTDSYPAEVVWQIKNATTNNIVQSGGPYSSPSTLYREEMCVDVDKSYDFTVLDSFGDGVCCAFGYGTYIITLGDRTIFVSNGIFGASETTTFQAGHDNSEGGVAPSIAPTYTVSAGEWVTITYDDFETGWGSFTTSGGTSSDTKRVQGIHVPSGMYALRIRDNSGTQSSIFHAINQDVSPYSIVRVQFAYCAKSIEGNEDFFVEYSRNNGGTWNIARQFVNRIDFVNDGCYWLYDTDAIEIDSANMDQIKIRFRCDASGDRDFIFIDEVSFQGLV